MIKTMKIAFGDVMVISVLSSSTVDHRFRPLPIKPKTIELVFAASPLGMQY